VNPRVGSDLQWSQGHGGENRRGGEKPRGRIADGNGRSHPEGRQRRGGHAPNRSPGRRTPWLSYDGGAIFGQPQERKPSFAAGSQGPERVGGRRQGQEGRAHQHIREGARTGRWSSKASERPQGALVKVTSTEPVDDGGQR